MKQRPLILTGVVTALLLSVLWFLFLHNPENDKLKEKQDDLSLAEGQEIALRQELASLESLKEREAEIDADLARVKGMIPDTPELAIFIREASRVAEEADIDWLNVAPSTPVEAGSYARSDVTFQFSGKFFAVIDYLSRLQELSRTVTFQSMQVSPSSGEEGTILTVSMSGKVLSLSGQIPNGPLEQDVSMSEEAA